MGWLEWLLSVILKNLGQWILTGLQEMYKAYTKRKENEAANKEIRENVENAQTPEEAQDALNDAARRLGRKP